MIKDIRLTKRLERLFKAYRVKIRDHNTTVTHKTYGETTVCPPIVFAVFEVAIKSVYASTVIYLAVKDDMAACSQYRQWYESIADDGEFFLPYIADEDITEKNGTAHSDNYLYCVDVLTKAGFYHQLLD